MAFARLRGKIVHIYFKNPLTGRMNSKSTWLENTPENQMKIKEFVLEIEKQVEELIMKKKGIGGGTSVEELIEQHLASKSKCAESTRRNYVKTYDLLSRSVDFSRQCVDEINLKQMTNVINTIYSNSDYAASTQAFHVRNIFNIVKFANLHNFVSGVVLDDSLRPKKSKGKRIPLTIEYVQKLVNYAKNKGDVHALAFIILMLHHGLRPKEIMNLSSVNIDLYNKLMTVNFTKTKKEYAIPIHPLCIDMLEYLKKIQKPGKGLFRVKLDTMFGIVNNYFRELGIREEGLSIYNLRHTFITNAKLNHVRDDALALLLGHTLGNVRSDIYYDEALPEAAKEIVKVEYPIPNFFTLIEDYGTASKIEEEFDKIKETEFMQKYPDIWRKLQYCKTPNLEHLINKLNLIYHALDKGFVDKKVLECLSASF